MMRSPSFRTVLLIGSMCLPVARAAAQVTCGAALPPGSTTTLNADLGPCDGGDAAITMESATLDLGGRTITCADGNGDGGVPAGIVLRGKKASVRNGAVTGCNFGVVAGGDGKHRVEAVTATNNVRDGIFVESDKNTVSGNSDEGMEITGDRNVLKGNTASGNDTQGIDIEGSRNQIKGNTSTANVGGPDPIDSAGSDGCRRNKWRGNTFGSRSPDCIK